MKKQTTAAAAVTVVSIAVAIVVNLLTSGWSWTFFVLLAVLAAVWVALAVWQVSAGRIKPLGAPAATAAGGIVARPELSSRIVRLLLGSGTRKVAITTGLWGAGGFGKTTLAAEVCENPEIKAAFGANIWWVTVGQEVRGAALADTINDVIKRIDGQSPGLTRPEQAGMHLGALLKERGRSLLVVDDVWSAEQLRPFLDAGRGCTLLVTTRFSDVLPGDAEPVEVNEMRPDQASALVNSGLAGLPDSVRDGLLDITGRWPLALSLANAALRRADRTGADVVETARKLLQRLQELGPAALDVTDADRRDRTVAATLESSLSLLGERRDRVVELAIFPEDTDIPRDLIALLWHRTAGLSSDETDLLCQEIVDLSLATGLHRVRLHDVIRSYLRHECGLDRLTALHNTFLDGVAATLPADGWWQLPDEQEHLWRTLAYHLTGAQRTEELAELVEAPAWLIGKLRKLGPVAVAEDVALVDNEHSRELTRFLDQLGHTLTPTNPEHAVVNALAHRLIRYPVLKKLQEAAITETRDVPRLVPRGPMPDLPDPALNRVLVGHNESVIGCAFSPTGKWLATICDDDTIRVWDPNTGRLLQVINSTEPLFGNSVLSSDGKWLAVEGVRALIHVFDTSSWAMHVTLDSRGSLQCFTFLDDGTLVAANDRKQLIVWDVAARDELRRFKIGRDLDRCAAMTGTTLLGLDDGFVRLWHTDTGKHVTLTELQSTYWSGMAIDPSRRWMALADDAGLFVLDLSRPSQPPRILRHHPELTTAVFSPRGDLLATADDGGVISIWEVAEWRLLGRISGHGSLINELAFSPDGSILASAGEDKTARLWDPSLASERIQHTAASACAVAPDGTWLAVSTPRSTIIQYTASPEPVLELEFAYNARKLTSLRGGALLLVEKFREILLCDANDWYSGRALEHPEGRFLSSASGGGSFVCVTGSSGQAYLWNVDNWGPPKFVMIDADSVRLTDGPPAEPQRWSRPRRKAPTPARIVGASIALSGDSLVVATDTAIFIIAPGTGEVIATIPVQDSPAGAVISPDGRWLVFDDGDGLQVWDTGTCTHRVTLAEISTEIEGAAWTPDNSLIAVVTQDQVVRIYDTATWQCLTSIRLDGKVADCDWAGNTDLVVVGRRGVYRFDFCGGSPEATG
ncbi:NB-ARC domain-containing protein [Lentzea nigeriaca]|uniref:NB-ARC domain-containing protein n=1 Tax=Lentzea nigeriaca TaxID=1128665 RepID=UPI001958109B|nr:NB-ARC domain-containing protein [Lentzea nigeriaca]MBM7859581.1 WD40 repeat protein [Lentzea nigeriaca]